jgi:hypothetical protein
MNKHKLGDKVWYMSTGQEWYIDRFKVKSGTVVGISGSLYSRVVEIKIQDGEVLPHPSQFTYATESEALAHAKKRLINMIKDMDKRLEELS